MTTAMVAMRVQDGLWMVGWTTNGIDFTPAADGFTSLHDAINFANELDPHPAPPTADVPTADSTAAVGNRRPSGSPARGDSGTPVAGVTSLSTVTGAIQSN